MADTYGVVPADIAAELPGLFPGGFTVSTKPTSAQVKALITTADTIVTLQVQDVTGGAPASTDRAADLAKRYIIDWVKAQIIRIVYAGNDAAAVAAAASPYDASIKAIGVALEQLGAQSIGTGAAAARVSVPYTTPQRDLLVTDEQLDNDESFRERRY